MKLASLFRRRPEPPAIEDQPPARVLFLTRKHASWGPYSSGPKDCGAAVHLTHSTDFLVEMLTGLRITASSAEVSDSEIDDAVAEARPTHVCFDYWVAPEAFDELMIWYPGVQWIVRNRAQSGTLALEGVGFEAAKGYLRRGVEVMCSSLRSLYDIAVVCSEEQLSLGPNFTVPVPTVLLSYGPDYYPIEAAAIKEEKDPNYIDLAAFGAIGPLSNHTSQAIAALQFAREAGPGLRFHVNRVESGGEPILKSLRAILGPRLVEHPWYARAEFLQLMRTMDISMQASRCEAFGFVTADAVACDVPVVVSPEIGWLGSYAQCQANPASVKAILSTLRDIWTTPSWLRTDKQRADLAAWNQQTEAAWTARFSRP